MTKDVIFKRLHAIRDAANAADTPVLRRAVVAALDSLIDAVEDDLALEAKDRAEEKVLQPRQP